MEDIQDQPDERNIPIDSVGIRGLSYPIKVLDRLNKMQATVADIDVSVDLPGENRATHMSRFVETLQGMDRVVSNQTIPGLLRDVRSALSARKAQITLSFPYFIEKTAPVSKMKSLMRYDCKFFGNVDETDQDDFLLTVAVPVTTLCPCSKAISKESAHNQRAIVSVSLRFTEIVWIEEVARLVEESSSAEVFTLLKRSDEKFLTEQAYSRPRFTEDLVRETALKLDAIDRVTWYTVMGESIESIHAHSAYAFLKRDKSS